MHTTAIPLDAALVLAVDWSPSRGWAEVPLVDWPSDPDDDRPLATMAWPEIPSWRRIRGRWRPVMSHPGVVRFVQVAVVPRMDLTPLPEDVFAALVHSLASALVADMATTSH